VTSVNSIAPAGRGGVGLGLGEATATSGACWACGVTVADGLQAQIKAKKQNRINADKSFMRQATLA
jgi:hypothetical protein